jgi:hypothetical protein
MTALSHAALLTAVLQRDVLKAITLTQPWAQLVAIGAKRIETRSWSCTYEGPLAIHAAKNFPTWAEETADHKPFAPVLEATGYHWRVGIKHNTRCLPLGQVIAVAWLQAVKLITPDFRVTSTERAFGNYTLGRYAWHFSTVYRLTTPIAVRGSLGLWNWQPPDAFWREVQEQLDQERAL